MSDIDWNDIIKRNKLTNYKLSSFSLYIVLTAFNFRNMENIIKNNYVVVKYFDNHFDGYASKKYLSKEDANDIYKKRKTNYLIAYKVIEHTSIVGVVNFNGYKAYIFNKEITKECSNDINITAGHFEGLMDCYVFTSTNFNKNELETLEKEYYDRGGKFFEKYHDYENEILKPLRKNRQREFRDEIVEHIIKHDFREVGKNKWKNKDGVIIKQTDTQTSSVKYPYCKKHIDVKNLSLNKKMLIGSIFSNYMKNINQLSGNKFNVPCNKMNRSTYHFTCF